MHRRGAKGVHPRGGRQRLSCRGAHGRGMSVQRVQASKRVLWRLRAAVCCVCVDRSCLVAGDEHRRAHDAQTLQDVFSIVRPCGAADVWRAVAGKLQRAPPGH